MTMRENLEYLGCCFSALVLLPMTIAAKFIAVGVERLFLVALYIFAEIWETLRGFCVEDELAEIEMNFHVHRPIDKHARILVRS